MILYIYIHTYIIIVLGHSPISSIQLDDTVQSDDIIQSDDSSRFDDSIQFEESATRTGLVRCGGASLRTR